MSRFLSQLFLRSLSPTEVLAAGRDVQLYEVTADFSFESDRLKRVVTVRAGRVTDFASIPRAVWGLLDPEDIVIAWPSVIHDDLFTRGGVLEDGFKYSFDDANAVLREGMEVCGAPLILRQTVYEAVTAFGRSHWKTPPP